MLTLDPDAVLATSRQLVRHGLDVADHAARAGQPPPDTGPTSADTASGLQLLQDEGHSLADSLRRLGDGLDAFVDTVVATDGHVGLLHDVLYLHLVL